MIDTLLMEETTKASLFLNCLGAIYLLIIQLLSLPARCSFTPLLDITYNSICIMQLVSYLYEHGPLSLHDHL